MSWNERGFEFVPTAPRKDEINRGASFSIAALNDTLTSAGCANLKCPEMSDIVAAELSHHGLCAKGVVISKVFPVHGYVVVSGVCKQ